ncbi:MAG: taurine catabolism dioxygenase TauD [Rhodospirillaceae bacterium]|nr:taurine catabolism dioxygenase TauD [Rhodospirillaceae bacterium]
MTELELQSLSTNVGVEAIGVDLATINEKTHSAITRALDQHSSVLFRDQNLTPSDLVAFSRRFGDLDQAPVMENGKTAVPGYPEIYIVSNIKGDDGKPIGSLGSGEAVWHTDMSYLENPPDISMLYALEVPSDGGNTTLCSMAAAHDELPAYLRKRIAKLSIKHDGTYNSGGFLRKGIREDRDPMTCEGQSHPVICAHPRTGRPVLYLGRRRNAYIMGLERKESEKLLNQVWDFATLPQYTYCHEWRVGDLLMWDNRSTMHRREPFPAADRRLMQRTQIRGREQPKPMN